MNIKILDLTNEEEVKRVEEFINSKENVDVKQTIRWYKLRNEKKYFLYISYNKKIILSCNAFSIFDTVVSDECLYIPRGPVFDEKVISLSKCIENIAQFAKNIGIKYLRINSKIKNIDEIGDKFNYTVISKNDFDKMLESYREASLKIDNVSAEELLQNFHYKTRYNIRKSLKNGLKTHITCDEFDYDTFYNLYLQTASRHMFSPHELQYFRKLIKIFGDMIVFCVVAYENEILAMSINIKISNTLYYLYGVSSNDYKNLFPCYNLHWSMILYAKENGFEYYNFGGVFSNDEDKSNKDYGLLVFKSRFCYRGFEEYVPDILINIGGKI